MPCEDFSVIVATVINKMTYEEHEDWNRRKPRAEPKKPQNNNNKSTNPHKNLYQFTRAAQQSTANCMALHNRKLCLTVLENRNLKSGCQQGYFVIKKVLGELLFCMYQMEESTKRC